MPENTGVTGTLTDGTGISKFTSSKVVKDLVLDFLLSAPVALIGVNVLSLDQALALPATVGLALGDSVIRVVYRAVLRWAQST